MLNVLCIDSSGLDWTNYWDQKLTHVGPALQRRLLSTKTLRRDLVAIFAYVAESRHRERVPITADLQIRAVNDGQSYVEKYLSCGGSVASTILTCFDRVQDEYVCRGNEHYEKACQVSSLCAPSSHQYHRNKFLKPHVHLKLEMLTRISKQAEIGQLPACRNDREFGFVCRQYFFLDKATIKMARHVTRRMQRHSPSEVDFDAWP